KFAGKPEHIVRFFLYLAQQVRMILADMGYRSLGELVGRSELLSVRSTTVEAEHTRSVDLGLGDLLADSLRAIQFAATASGRLAAEVPRSSRQPRNDRPGRSGGTVDDQLTEDALAALNAAAAKDELPQVRLAYQVTNRERSLGSGLA